MRALSIRQPYAELILRGIKTAEIRSRPTSIVGERFYIYAAKAKAKPPIWSEDLEAIRPPAWMIELAEQVKLISPGELDALPTGVIVGSAVIERVEEVGGESDEATKRLSDEGEVVGASSVSSPCVAAPLGGFAPPASAFLWHLTDVRRAKRLRKPARHPQPAWFRAF